MAGGKHGALLPARPISKSPHPAGSQTIEERTGCRLKSSFAGFGGQGILFAGQLLAYAALDEDKETTWIPSYGPEMRGGTANCTVIIADEEIGSPLVQPAAAVIAMNLPSLDKYEPLVRTGGVLVVNQSIVNREVEAHGYPRGDDPRQRYRREAGRQAHDQHGAAGRAAGE